MENTILGEQTHGNALQNQAAEKSDAATQSTELLVVVGPTAVGKTAVAIELALQVRGEIINADSMQVYTGMDIGTAKPGPDERKRVPFHLIDIASPNTQLTVAEWKLRAEEAIADIRAREKTPIVCGGTGLYVRSLLYDWQHAGTPPDPGMRNQLNEKVVEFGSHALHSELAAVDPATAARLHPNDAVRIVRALEVYYTSGISLSELHASDRNLARCRSARQFGLMRPRAELYGRIDERVDQMIRVGLEAEVRRLLGQGYSSDLGAMRSLGYKEMVQYIQGEVSYIETLHTIKQSTRRYSKRQQTWFRADKAVEWIDVSALSSATVASQIVKRLEQDAFSRSLG